MIIDSRGVKIDLRDGFSDQDRSIVKDVIERDCYHLLNLEQHIGPTPTIIDIGAHIGSFSLFAAKLWPRARIFAFEPNPQSLKAFERNIRINDFVSITATCEAVSSRDDKTVIMSASRQSTISFLATESERVTIERGGSVENPVHKRFNTAFGPFRKVADLPAANSLNAIIEEHNLATIDILKIDCEGSETEILTNLSATNAGRIKHILGEYHIGGGYSHFCELIAGTFPTLKFHRDGTLLRRALRRIKTVLKQREDDIGHFFATQRASR